MVKTDLLMQAGIEFRIQSLVRELRSTCRTMWPKKKKKKENIGAIYRPEQDTEKELSQSVQTQVCKEHRGMCFKVIDLPDYMPRETEHLFAEFF